MKNNIPNRNHLPIEQKLQTVMTTSTINICITVHVNLCGLVVVLCDIRIIY